MENENLGEYIQKKLMASLKNNEKQGISQNVEEKSKILKENFRGTLSKVKAIIQKYTDEKIPLQEVEKLLGRVEEEFDMTRLEVNKHVNNLSKKKTKLEINEPVESLSEKTSEEYDIESLLSDLTSNLPAEIESVIKEKNKEKIYNISLNNVKSEVSKKRENAYKISQRKIEDKVESEIMDELKTQISRVLESRKEWPVDIDDMRYSINDVLKSELLNSIKSKFAQVDEKTLVQINVDEDFLFSAIYFECVGEMERIINEALQEMQKNEPEKSESETGSSFEEELKGDVNSLEEVAENSANEVYENEEPEKDSKEQDLPGDVVV